MALVTVWTTFQKAREQRRFDHSSRMKYEAIENQKARYPNDSVTNQRSRDYDHRLKVPRAYVPRGDVLCKCYATSRCRETN